MKADQARKHNQAGIALITTLLLLLLMAAMVVGFMLLVTEGQRLSGMDSDQLRAFYGAESGMEKLTADLGTLFSATYAPTGAQVNALTANPPTLPSTTGVSYVDSQGQSTYSIDFPKDTKGNPQAQFAQITSGSSAFQGMSALETTYTLTVGALTNTGGQVKLQRTTQTVGIPLFQFGIFSDTDLSFFPGPNFDFGGRVHTNGNLFLDSGSQLFMRSPVTASKDIMRDCLSNTHPEPGPHGGAVQITKGGGVLQGLGFGQGSLKSCLGSGKNPNWPAVSASFNGNLRSGVKPLNLTIVLLGNGNSTPVDLIRRPVQGELGSNPGVLGERYFSQASLRVLLSDDPTDINNLPCVSPGAPFNLADLASPVTAWGSANAGALKGEMTAAGTTPLPLAASGAASGVYAPGNGIGGATTPGGDGYWQANGTKILTGYIKIDAQTSYGAPCGVYKDVTQEILSLGYAGKNINPVPQSLDGATLNPAWAGNVAYMQGGASPALPSPPASQMSGQGGAALAAGTFTANSTLAAPTGTCLDPHPNAVIRLERIRDNPSSVPFASGKLGVPNSNLPLRSAVAQVCGVDPATGQILAGWNPQPSDFWPNALFDTREGYNREPAPLVPFNNRVTLGGIMNYVELDVKNLARWFGGAIGASGPSTQDPSVAPNNFVVYISDRRSNYLPTGTAVGAWPPLSPSGHETGEYGYADYVNRADINGCPDSALEPATSGGISPEDPGASGVLNTYGEVTFPPGLINSTGVTTASTIWSLAPVVADPLCPTGSGGINPWPRSFLLNANEGRENPNALFRRAVKVVNGSSIILPACPGGVSCGLSVTTENPIYVQGDYNANSAGGGFADPSVASALAGDAITVLSKNWNDINSFAFPFNNPSARTGATTYVRAGVMGGKEVSFTIPAWDTAAVDGSQDFGTDGGVHNFIRFLERWNGTLFYEGSIVSMFYNRQAVGLFNTGGNNYSPPTRGYQFDVNFLNPALLPPRTPMFRDVNTTGFTQLLLPNQ